MAVPDIAHYPLRTLDNEIAQYREKIEDLQAEREKALLRETASERAMAAALTIMKESGLGIEDLFDSQSRPIRTWITKQVGQQDTIWADLKSHFILNSEALPSAVTEKRRETSRAPAKPSVSDGPTLAPGRYRNPYSKKAITVDPQSENNQSGMAYEWCQVFGFMTVETWRVNEREED